MLKSSLAVLALSLIAATTYAQDGKRSPGLLERGIARVEQGWSKLQAKLSGRKDGDSSEGCSDMMGGAMIGDAGKGGGMMGSGGMMGGGVTRGGAPNEQWRGSGAR